MHIFTRLVFGDSSHCQFIKCSASSFYNFFKELQGTQYMIRKFKISRFLRFLLLYRDEITFIHLKLLETDNTLDLSWPVIILSPSHCPATECCISPYYLCFDIRAHHEFGWLSTRCRVILSCLACLTADSLSRHCPSRVPFPSSSRPLRAPRTTHAYGRSFVGRGRRSTGWSVDHPSDQPLVHHWSLDPRFRAIPLCFVLLRRSLSPYFTLATKRSGPLRRDIPRGLQLLLSITSIRRSTNSA